MQFTTYPPLSQKDFWLILIFECWRSALEEMYYEPFFKGHFMSQKSLEATVIKVRGRSLIVGLIGTAFGMGFMYLFFRDEVSVGGAVIIFVVMFLTNLIIERQLRQRQAKEKQLKK